MQENLDDRWEDLYLIYIVYIKLTSCSVKIKKNGVDMRSLLVIFILAFSSYSYAECGYHVDGSYRCGSNCGYKADGKFRCGSNCGYKADGKFRCNKSQAKDSANDNCGYKADGKYHCGKNCGYRADGKFHCGENCGYKGDGNFRCE